MKRTVLLVFVFLVFAFAPLPLSAGSSEEILIIANNSLQASRVSDGELRDIFLGKKSNWGTGLRAVPIHSNNRALRDDFRTRLLQMNEAEETRYWQAYQIKTGKSQPASFGNTLKAVYKLKGAVSYIYKSQYKEGVAKVVAVLPAP